MVKVHSVVMRRCFSMSTSRVCHVYRRSLARLLRIVGRVLSSLGEEGAGRAWKRSPYDFPREEGYVIVTAFFVVSPDAQVPPPRRGASGPSKCFPTCPYIPLSKRQREFSPSTSTAGWVIPSIPISKCLPSIHPRPTHPRDEYLYYGNSENNDTRPLPRTYNTKSRFHRSKCGGSAPPYKGLTSYNRKTITQQYGPK